MYVRSCLVPFTWKFCSLVIRKTRLYNFDPLKPHFYIVKLGFTGVHIIFLSSAQNIHCGYPLEPPHRGSSNEYPQCMFWAEIWKYQRFFYLKKFSFLEVKFSIYLNRHVFVMLNEESTFMGHFVLSSRKREKIWEILFVLRFYGPVNPMGSCRARSVYLTTRYWAARLSLLSG